jgi:dipeptidyl aminopeptidase/acylaminoacyl peptidase
MPVAITLSIVNRWRDKVLLTSSSMCRALAVLLLVTPSLAADLPLLIPRKILFGNPQQMMAKVSPDGKHIAWIAPANGVLNVWVRGIQKPATRAKVLTRDPRRGIREYYWSPDSRSVLYLQDHDGDENWRIFQVMIERPGEARALTPRGAQVRIISIHPNFHDHIVIGLNERDARFHDAFRLDLRTDALTLLAKNPGDVEYYVADNRMNVRAAYAQLADGSGEVRVRDAAGDEWRRLDGWSDEEVEGIVLAFSPDDRKLWYTTSVGSNSGQLIEVNIATGKKRIIAVDARQQHDAGEIIVHPISRKLQAVEFIRARREWEVIDPELRSHFAALKHAHRGDFRIESRDNADRYWTVSYDIDNGPRSYYFYDSSRRKAALLFQDRPGLSKYRLSRMEPVTFPASDGLKLFGYLTLPLLPKSQQKKLPLIVLPHGGPYARDEWGYDDRVQFFANRGYAVLQIDYRGSTGYGKKHLQAGFRERGGKMSTDLIDGKRWAVAQGYADAKRTCMYGVSYGGYAVLVALAFTPEEFTCGVEAYGASNLASLLKSFPPYWTLYRRQWERRVGYAHEEEFLKSRSALFKVDQIKAPLLIGQGVNDPRVVKAESDQIVAALRKNGKEVEYLVFPDEGHGFLRPENRTKWFAATEAFLAKHLHGRAELPAADERWDELRQ